MGFFLFQKILLDADRLGPTAVLGLMPMKGKGIGTVFEWILDTYSSGFVWTLCLEATAAALLLINGGHVRVLLRC